jgi:hypothetical protein
MNEFATKPDVWPIPMAMSNAQNAHLSCRQDKIQCHANSQDHRTDL